MIKTYDIAPHRLDRRELRAMQVVSLVLMAAERTLPQDVITRRQMKAFADEVQKQFMENGVELFTDWHRQQLNMPARGPDGWTMQEILALDVYLSQVHICPPTIIVTDEVAKGLQQNLMDKPAGFSWVAPPAQSKIE